MVTSLAMYTQVEAEITRDSILQLILKRKSPCLLTHCADGVNQCTSFLPYDTDQLLHGKLECALKLDMQDGNDTIPASSTGLPYYLGSVLPSFFLSTRRTEFCFVLTARVRRQGELFDVLYDDGDQEFYVKVWLKRSNSALCLYFNVCVCVFGIVLTHMQY